MKVLHLDDSPSQLNVTKLIIERIDPGLFVEKISSPKEALKRLRAQTEFLPPRESIRLLRMNVDTSNQFDNN